MLGKDRIMLHSPDRPCEQLELGLGKEARIRGVVDAELRSLAGHRNIRMPHRSAAVPKPRLLNAQTLIPISRTFSAALVCEWAVLPGGIRL